jgi:hypothetical protein
MTKRSKSIVRTRTVKPDCVAAAAPDQGIRAALRPGIRAAPRPGIRAASRPVGGPSQKTILISE